MPCKTHIGSRRVLVIPDLQAPYHHPDAVRFLSAVRDKVDPTDVVCIGDSLDFHAMSNWDSDPDGDSAGTEYAKALSFLDSLYDEFPEAVEVESNHNRRVARKAFQSGIPSAFIRSQPEWMNYPDGWSLASSVSIDGVRYEHGDRQGGIYAARNLALVNGCSTVIGHHHSHASIHYIHRPIGQIFGMNVGCLIDPESFAFAYAKMAKFLPVLSCGVVLYGSPVLIPMMVGTKGRMAARQPVIDGLGNLL